MPTDDDIYVQLDFFLNVLNDISFRPFLLWRENNWFTGSRLQIQSEMQRANLVPLALHDWFDEGLVIRLYFVLSREYCWNSRTTW